MSNVKITGNASGSGSLTIAAPNTNSDLTLNLPTTLGNNGTSALVSTDASGNLGLGVTPSGWSGQPSIQFANSIAVGTLGLTRNAYWDGSAYKYISTAAATQYLSFNGEHRWSIAPSGTAGTAITFTQAMTLDASGRLGIGTSSPTYKTTIVESNTGAASTLLAVHNSGIDANTEARIVLAGGNGLTNRHAYIGAINGGASAGNPHSLVFATNANSAAPVERLRIDSSGNVGIGTTSPTAKLSVEGSTAYAVTSSGNATTSGIDINSSAGGAGLFGGAVSFGAGGTGRAAIAALQNTADNDTATLAFFIHASGTSSTDASEAMRITSDGYLRMASGTSGIQFNGDTAAANALDDYEEGTFTPTIIGTTTAGTGTYTTQVGRYTKIGRLVTVTLTVTWTAHTGSGTMRVSGLPFTVVNASTVEFLGSAEYPNMTMPANSVPCTYTISNTTLAAVAYFVTGNGAAQGISMDTAASAYMTITYEAA